jgi:DNA-binding CsgD family transcriptional regulator
MLASFSQVLNDFWSSTEAVSSARSPSEVEAAAARFCSNLGFEHFGYATRTRELTDERYSYFHNIAGPYGKYRYEYVYRNEPETDPVLVHLQSGLPAASFSSKDGIELGGADANGYKNILRAAAEHGIRAGIGVPLSSTNLKWGFMLLTTPLTDKVDDVRPYLPHLCLFAHYAFVKMRSLHASNTLPCHLSKRQAEVLRWAAVGKTSWEIGRILTISEATVNFHLSEIAKRLGTRGRRATCARAVALGLIGV